MTFFPDSLGAPETTRSLPLRERLSKGIHVKDDSRFTDRAQRCHKHVAGKVDNVYAVCNASIIRKRGKAGAYRPGHYKK